MFSVGSARCYLRWCHFHAALMGRGAVVPGDVSLAAAGGVVAMACLLMVLRWVHARRKEGHAEEGVKGSPEPGIPTGNVAGPRVVVAGQQGRRLPGSSLFSLPHDRYASEAPGRGGLSPPPSER